MSKPLPSPFDKKKVVAENRRARFDYFVDERLEAGIQLVGRYSMVDQAIGHRIVRINEFARH